MSNADKVLSLIEKAFDWYRDYKGSDQQLRERQISLKENEFNTKLRGAQEDHLTENGGPKVGSYGEFKIDEGKQRRFEKEAADLKKTERGITYTVEGFSIAEGYVMEDDGDGNYRVVKRSDTEPEQTEKSIEKPAETFKVWTLPPLAVKSADYLAVQNDIRNALSADPVLEDVVKAGRRGVKRYRSALKAQLDHWVAQEVIESYNAKQSTVLLEGKLLKILEKNARTVEVLDETVTVLKTAKKALSEDTIEETPENNIPVTACTGESKADEADTVNEKGEALVSGTSFKVWTLQRFNDTKIARNEADDAFDAADMGEGEDYETVKSLYQRNRKEYGRTLKEQLDYWVKTKVIGGYDSKFSTPRLEKLLLGVLESKNTTPETESKEAEVAISGGTLLHVKNRGDFVITTTESSVAEPGVKKPSAESSEFSEEILKTLENPDTPSKSSDGTEIGKEEFQIVGMKFINAYNVDGKSGALKYAEYIKRTAVWLNPATGKPEYVQNSKQVPVSQYALLVEDMCAEIKVNFSDITEGK